MLVTALVVGFDRVGVDLRDDATRRYDVLQPNL